MKILRITVVLLALTGSGFADDILGDTPENRAKAAGEYLSLVPTKDLADDMAEKLAATVPEEKRETFKSMLAKIFTVGELKAMIAYQSTPEGKSSLKKMGAYMADLMPVVQAELKKAMLARAKETQ